MLSALPLVEPAYANFPPWVETFGPEVADLAEMAGLPPDPEQAMGLDALFGIGANGLPSAFEFALIAARQNIKTAFFKMAALGWLFITDQKLIVWSAHEMDTTREAFRDLANLIENCAPLRKRLAGGPTNGIFRGSGQEAIELAPSEACPEGQRIKFKARTSGGGRGLSGDKVVLDEAYALKPDHMGSLLPTLSTRREAQVVYGSSAGRGESEVLRGIRDRGRPGISPRLAYMEFCGPPPEDACEKGEECPHVLGTAGCGLDNLEFVRMANPAMERRITIQYLLDERQSLPPAEYGRERLGWWDKPDVAEAPKITSEAWAALKDSGSTPVDPVSFGIYINKDRTSSAIGVAAYRADGLIHVGVVPARDGEQFDQLPGTGWIPGRAKELVERWSPCATVIDTQNAAASLITAIEEQGVSVATTSAQDMARACGNFDDAVKERQLRHQGSPALAQSVCAGKPRDLGDAWAWDRKDSGSDITQLVAVTLALHGLITFGRREVDVWGFMS
jgi:hypothetical protein